jgi:hypothetical protein
LFILLFLKIFGADARPGSERNYLTLYTYLASRDRFGVVGNANKKTVKDCYILPLAGAGPVPPTLLQLEAELPALGRTDTLLCMIVRTRRDREGGGTPVAAAVDLPPPKAPPVLPTPVLPANRPPAAAYKPAPYRQPTPAAAAPASPFLAAVQRRPPAASPAAAVPPPAVRGVEDDEEPYEPDDEEPYSPGNSPPAAFGQTAAGYSTAKTSVVSHAPDSPSILRYVQQLLCIYVPYGLYLAPNLMGTFRYRTGTYLYLYLLVDSSWLRWGLSTQGVSLIIGPRHPRRLTPSSLLAS